MPSIQHCVSMIPLQCLCILRLSCLARPSRYFHFPLKGLRHDGTSSGSPCRCRVGRPRPAWPFGQGPVRVLDHNGASAAGDCFPLTASLLPGDWNCYSEKKASQRFPAVAKSAVSRPPKPHVAFRVVSAARREADSHAVIFLHSKQPLRGAFCVASTKPCKTQPFLTGPAKSL